MTGREPCFALRDGSQKVEMEVLSHPVLPGSEEPLHLRIVPASRTTQPSQKEHVLLGQRELNGLAQHMPLT